MYRRRIIPLIWHILTGYRQNWKRSAKAGCRVLVPFGKGNKRCIGMIFRVHEKQEPSKIPLKPLIAVIDPEPVLTEEQLSLIGWLRDNTFCSYYDAVRAVLPLAFHMRIHESWKMGNTEIPDHLSSEALNYTSISRK